MGYGEYNTQLEKTTVYIFLYNIVESWEVFMVYKDH